MGRIYNGNSQTYNDRKVSYDDYGYSRKKYSFGAQRNRSNYSDTVYGDNGNNSIRRMSYAQPYHKNIRGRSFKNRNREAGCYLETSHYHGCDDYVEEEPFREVDFRDDEQGRHSPTQNSYNGDRRVILNTGRSSEIDPDYFHDRRDFRKDYKSNDLDSISYERSHFKESHGYSNGRSRRPLNSVDFQNNNARREFFSDYGESQYYNHPDVRINKGVIGDRDDNENYRSMHEIHTRDNSYDYDTSFQKRRNQDDDLHVIYTQRSSDEGKKSLLEGYNQNNIASRGLERIGKPSGSSNSVYDPEERDKLREYIMSAIQSPEFRSDAQGRENLKAFMDKLGVTLDEVQKYFDEELARRNDMNILQTSLRNLYRDKLLSSFFSETDENVQMQGILNKLHVSQGIESRPSKELSPDTTWQRPINPQDASLPSRTFSEPKVALQIRSQSPSRDYNDEPYLPAHIVSETRYDSTVSHNRSLSPVQKKPYTDIGISDGVFERRKSSSSLETYRLKSPISKDRLERDERQPMRESDRSRSRVREEKNLEIHRETRSLSRSSQSPVRWKQISSSEECPGGSNNNKGQCNKYTDSSPEHSKTVIEEMLLKAGDKSVEEFRQNQALASKFFLVNALRYEPSYNATSTSHKAIQQQHEIEKSLPFPKKPTLPSLTIKTVDEKALVPESIVISSNSNYSKNDDVEIANDEAECYIPIDNSDLTNEQTLSMLKKASKTSNRSAPKNVKEESGKNCQLDEEELKITKVINVKRPNSVVGAVVSVPSQRKVTVKGDEKTVNINSGHATQPQSGVLNKTKVRVPSWFNSRCIELLKKRHKYGQQLKKAQNDPNASNERLGSLKLSLRDINREYIPLVRKSKSEYIETLDKNNGLLKGSNKPAVDGTVSSSTKTELS